MDNYEKLTFLIYEYFSTFGLIFSFTMGACIGSFLNVCIWRLPRGENLSFPGSHCPKCNYEIPSYENLPIIAWLWLRGKCKSCRAGISPRYIIIETFTAFVFVFVTWQAKSMNLPIEQLLSLYFLASAFIAIIFIDIEHLIIPSKITWSGIIWALALCLLLPHAITLPETHELYQFKTDLIWLNGQLQNITSNSRVIALVYSIGGFLVGYAILWSVVELGKALFGKQKFSFKEPIKVTITKEGAQSEGDDILTWEDMFDRENDIFEISVLNGTWVAKDQEGDLSNSNLKFSNKGVSIDSHDFTLEDIKCINIQSKEFTIPREAMGRGDIKMLAMIGALMGPIGALFTLMIATFSGCFISGIATLTGKFKKGKQIPFGPYLAIACIIWMLYWPNLIKAYFNAIDYCVLLIGNFQ
jgi:leader peptidase (prepilin peptidase)/N-methyltransferase